MREFAWECGHEIPDAFTLWCAACQKLRLITRVSENDKVTKVIGIIEDNSKLRKDLYAARQQIASAEAAIDAVMETLKRFADVLNWSPDYDEYGDYKKYGSHIWLGHDKKFNDSEPWEYAKRAAAICAEYREQYPKEK